MLKIFSDLPKSVTDALQEAGSFEFVSEKHASIKLLSANFPPAPYRLGALMDFINNPPAAKKINIAGIEFDIAGKTAGAKKSKISLTEKEAEIIMLLYDASEPVSREQMLKQIWQYATDATTNTVETHIYRLRQKLTENFGIEVIDTVSGNYFIKTDA